MNNRGVPLFLCSFQMVLSFTQRSRCTIFCEWVEKVGFTSEPVAPLLTRISLSAPLPPKVTRIMLGIEKRRRLPCGVGYNVLAALKGDLYDLATR